jgi:hypothetical protein
VRILQGHWYPEIQSGDFHYRIAQPAAALAEIQPEIIHTLSIYQPCFHRLACRVPLLILHMVPDREIGALIAYRHSQGLPTLFEIPDHFLAVEPWTRQHQAFRTPEIRQNLLFHAFACGNIQFSTAPLARGYGRLAGRWAVFPNAIPSFAMPEKAATPLCLGWSGSLSHAGALLPLRQVLHALLRDTGMQLHIMGDPAIYRQMNSQDLAGQIHFNPSGDMAAYLAFWRKMHLGLAPLSPSPFNEGRSDGRFLELGICGVVPVLADHPVFQASLRHGIEGYLFRGESDLDRLLRRLAHHPNLRARLARAAYDRAAARNTEAMARQRLQWYESLLPEFTRKSDIELPVDAVDAVDALHDARVHRDPLPDPAAVLRAMPEHDLARYHLARLTRRFPEKALPPHLEQLLCLDAHQEPGWPGQAPEPTLELLMRQLRFARQPDEASARDLLALHPFHYQALTHLLSCALQRQDRAMAKRLLQLCRNLAPDEEILSQCEETLRQDSVAATGPGGAWFPWSDPNRPSLRMEQLNEGPSEAQLPAEN